MDQCDIEMEDNNANDTSNINKRTNAVDIESQTCDESSQDLFNDDASAGNSPCVNLDVSQIIGLKSPLDLFATPTQTSRIRKEESRSPTHATVPSIPSSLVPFISTVNESWTSDLETPQAKTVELHQNQVNVQPKSCEYVGNKGYDLMVSNNVTSHVTTPNGCFTAKVEDESLSASPVLHTMNKRHRPKRRILKSLETTIPKTILRNATNTHTSVDNIAMKPIDHDYDGVTSVSSDFNDITNSTFVIVDNRSLHNSNISQIHSEEEDVETNRSNEGVDSRFLFHKTITSDLEHQFITNDISNSPLVMNRSSENIYKENLSMTGLQNCKDSEKINRNDTLGSRKPLIGSAKTSVFNFVNDKVLLDSTEFNSCNDKSDSTNISLSRKKSMTARVKLIKELKKKKQQVSKFEPVDIPIHVFTRAAEALESAKISATASPKKHDLKKDWGLISFTEMCLLEEEELKNQNLPQSLDNSINYSEVPADEANDLASSLKNGEIVIDKEIPKKLSAASSEADGNHSDVFSLPLTHTEEPLIDIDEFSPWFYPSNETKSASTSDLNNVTNIPQGTLKNMQKGSEAAMEQPDRNEEIRNGENQSKIWPSGSTVVKQSNISKSSIESNDRLCVPAALENVKSDSRTLLQSYSSPGFSTASGKPISISEDKIRRATELYKEIAMQDQSGCDGMLLDEISRNHVTNKVTINASIPRSSASSATAITANKSVINTSKDNLAKTVHSFEEVGCHRKAIETVDMPQIGSCKVSTSRGLKRQREYCDTDSYGMSEVGSNFGFTTASGKPLLVSEIAMKKAKLLMYQDESLKHQLPLHEEPKTKLRDFENVKKNNSGIKSYCDAQKTEITVTHSLNCDTGSGGHVEIKQSSTTKAGNLSSDKYSRQSLELSGTISQKSYSVTENHSRQLVLLENESQVTRSTSKSESDKLNLGNISKNVLTDVTSNTKVAKDFGRASNAENWTANNYAISNKISHNSTGFNTASGKAIPISEKALSNAKILWTQTVDGCDSDSFNHILDKENSIARLPTDSEKPPKTSDQMLSKVDIRMESGEHNTGDSEFSKYKPDNKYTTAGFSTGSGKPIKISDQALTKAKILMMSEEQNSFEFSQLNLQARNKDTREDSTANSDWTKIDESVTMKVKKPVVDKQENSPQHNDSRKRNSSAVEVCNSNNISVFTTPGIQLLSENITSDDTSEGALLYQKSEKVGLNSDIQARKLFAERDCDTGEEMENMEHRSEENQSLGIPVNSNKNYACHMLKYDRKKNNTVRTHAKSDIFPVNDRLMIPKLEPQKSWPTNPQNTSAPQFSRKLNAHDTIFEVVENDRRMPTVSEEITASTKALLADEANFQETLLWAAAITCSPPLIENEETSVRPSVILNEDCDVQEIPCSPIIGDRFRSRSRKKHKRKSKSSLKKDLVNLEVTKDDKSSVTGLEEQIDSQCFQQSSGITTSTSGSSEQLRRNISPVIETASSSMFAEYEVTEKNVPVFNNQVDNPPNPVSSVEIEQDVISNILENRLAATLAQEKKIRAKKKFKSKPIAGSLFLCKTQKTKPRLSLRELTNGASLVPRTSDELADLAVGLDIMEVTAATAVRYRFKCSDFYSKDKICTDVYGIVMVDGGLLIFDENGYAGVDEFEQAFIASPGVDPSLVPHKWVGNHYRWIVWKLASMDRMKFGDLSFSRMLTPDHVMEQLKYRYDREIDKSERPALRRIIEKDDPACRRMILCVATITKIENDQGLEKMELRTISTSQWRVELTDGWYSITASIDAAMSRLIAFGKVREGTKLVTCRAELLNSDQGCSPLEMPADVCLKIHSNSTRRVRWDTKLGYCKHVGSISTGLSAILVNGGLIGRLDVIVTRVYPIQYFEKSSNGQSIFRNKKCEDKAAMAYENERQAQVETICAQARTEFEARNRKQSRTSSSDPQTELWCCESIERDLSSQKSQSYHGPCEMSQKAFHDHLQSMLTRNLPPPRKVTQILKVRVAEGENTALLTIWAPSDDTSDVLKEGNRVSIHNVQTSGKRFGELQLTVGRQSVIKFEGSGASACHQRYLTPISEVGVTGFSPPFGEFDTVGIIISLGPAPHGMKNFEAMNLACPNADCSSSAYLSILFWDGIKAHGCSDILSIGSTVACTNLQWRRSTPWAIPVAYATEHSTFTRYPRQAYLHSAFDIVNNQITDPLGYISQCATDIAKKNEQKPSATRSPGSVNTSNQESSPAVVLYQRYGPGMSPRTPQGALNPGGNTTPAKYSIQKRLEKLQWYGEPPDLSPIPVNRSSLKINRKFVPPIRMPEH
ncbi:breast cancer type 2 susceptibility protein isoform X1 [Neodiprion pinetum]|uniref:breast cancer type 2 susceptibility protein isoform X1 n=1 Tax=Neodiprion pinetum TaxID=441929 RepID=UPI001EE13EB7|nr:breast cancer type 2 susceptibility protein homolog isoform X1 [Neodiprion pinetum]